jgi:hypothetical protein
MLWKLLVTLVFVVLFLPHEPDLRMGRPTSFSPIILERIQTALFDALDKVRADLKANRGDGRSYRLSKCIYAEARVFVASESISSSKEDSSCAHQNILLPICRS